MIRIFNHFTWEFPYMEIYLILKNIWNIQYTTKQKKEEIHWKGNLAIYSMSLQKENGKFSLEWLITLYKTLMFRVEENTFYSLCSYFIHVIRVSILK